MEFRLASSEDTSLHAVLEQRGSLNVETARRAEGDAACALREILPTPWQSSPSLRLLLANKIHNHILVPGVPARTRHEPCVFASSETR